MEPYSRTLSEQIRDLYLDRITDRILSSTYRGRIRFLADTELDFQVDQDMRGRLIADGRVAHLLAPSEEELAYVLSPRGEFDTVHIYLWTGEGATWT